MHVIKGNTGENKWSFVVKRITTMKKYDKLVLQKKEEV